MTKKFKEWFKTYGLLDESPWFDSYVVAVVKRVAWRAYQRGRKEGREAGRREYAAEIRGLCQYRG